jgi:predicted transcriptional regulator
LAAELQRLFSKIKDKQERNKLILKVYEEGYSHHMIAKVLGITQQAVYGVIKRGRK